MSAALGMIGVIAAPVLATAVLSAVAVWAYLGIAARSGWGQPVRADGPEAHLAKKGTPTMGGIAFMPLALAVAGAWPVVGLRNRPLFAGVLVAGLGMTLIGLWDDATKVIGGKPEGVKARWRLIAQFAVAAGAVAIMHRAGLALPAQDPGWLGAWPLGMAGAIMQVLIIVGAVNAVNFTDGVDGLAAGTVAIAAIGLGACAMLLGSHMWMPLTALAGACLGFLVYNRNPAKVFMGDVGSLGIGGLLAAAAIAMRIEFAFFLLGGIFWLEMASVIGQVISFQTTGKRILKMAPFHHHLELSGWSEKKVVRVAYVVQVVLCVATVALVWKVHR